MLKKIYFSQELRGFFLGMFIVITSVTITSTSKLAQSPTTWFVVVFPMLTLIPAFFITAIKTFYHAYKVDQLKNEDELLHRMHDSKYDHALNFLFGLIFSFVFYVLIILVVILLIAVA